MNFLRSNSQTPTTATTLSPPPAPQSDVPWLMSTGAKVVSTIAGIFAIFIGVLSLFTSLLGLNATCILAGGLLAIEGTFMIVLEAPCFCTYFQHAYTPSSYLEAKPHWIKATVYLFFAAIPFFFCIGLTTFLSCGFILISCGLYLMMAMGRKASLDEMRVNANTVVSEKPSAVLVQNEELPKGTDPPPAYTAYTPQQSNTISGPYNQSVHY
ncbi:calcium channel flower-like [Oppia nitens]|uniref:calcium channel flower-like n=1 Tax=Oppia nitens TaxID=1686743 RepID=UPI0023DA068B|nr:calcium channel flower-like [Oppia nitens]XP_054156506.1 calcium channel flower-like [Oppia nitens]